MSNPYFIQFGCWNNGGCEETKNNGLTNVTRLLKLKTPEFIVISGDNYYPPKETIEGKKKKYFVENDFLSGFNCLPKNMPIYMNYGNHDYETDLIIDKNTGQTENNCELIKRQQLYVAENPNIQLDLFRAIDFSGSTKVIMIDTTIYDNEEFKSCYQCYRAVDRAFDTDDKTIIQTRVKLEQSKFINNITTEINSNSNIQNVVIVGHHPLMGFKIKEKKGVELVETLYSADLIEFIYNNIFNQINNPNIKYYYLCADLHQYQSGNVSINGKMSIRQYIVGTGGAKLDKYDKNIIASHNSTYSKTTNDLNSTYQMSPEDLENSTSENGFLICEKVNDINLSFKFETTNGRIIVGGKKTKKNRKKLNSIKSRRHKGKKTSYKRHIYKKKSNK
jgi:hypothetical protein